MDVPPPLGKQARELRDLRVAYHKSDDIHQQLWEMSQLQPCTGCGYPTDPYNPETECAAPYCHTVWCGDCREGKHYNGARHFRFCDDTCEADWHAAADQED